MCKWSFISLDRRQMSIGPHGSSSKKAQDNLEAQTKMAKELSVQASKQYNKAVANTNELLRYLLASKPQTQWDQICAFDVPP